MNRNFILEQIPKPEKLFKIVESLTQWIYRICESNNLRLKTTELAAQLIQICFAEKFCNLQNILLIAITSLFISVKYNESQSFIQFDLQDCIHLGSGTYLEKDFLEMELQILNLVNFDVNLITISDFLQEEQTKYIDLVLFVTLDSGFWSFSKFDLYEAILFFNHNHKKSQNETTNKIINLIQAKVNLLTAIENEQKNNFEYKTKRIQKQRFKQKRFHKPQFRKSQLKRNKCLNAIFI
ncbi:unnamed protein product [Paramecium sonneborni]|uniref:Cyclin-like domain-containing protein n=1 Tax=Paramecium sonneborni TaxID=65129 RepID=A0A8S1KN23_9CILI|nr:unnamed protein product [Paramecium sonneborni]